MLADGILAALLAGWPKAGTRGGGEKPHPKQLFDGVNQDGTVNSKLRVLDDGSLDEKRSVCGRKTVKED